ncbi:MAG: CoA transferase [Microbacteriaceae bacterium]
MNTHHAEQALQGVRVIDASTILAGPLCCRILGDYGAEVIKIEHPQYGDAMRGHGKSVNNVPIWWKEISRNKKNLGLNLKSAEGREILARLLGNTDIFVENFRPGTLESWGLAPEYLHNINPKLVIIRISGFGQEGPYSKRPGFGTLAESMSGFAHLTGPADGPPTLPAFGLADTICGIAASSAALMALRYAEKTGVGQVVDMSILGPMMEAVGPGPTIYDLTQEVGFRTGNASLNNSPRNTYQTRDKRWVAISTSAQSIAERVMRLIGHPELIEEEWFKSGSTRVLHREMLDGYVQDWIGQRDLHEVVRAFEEAEAAVAPIYDAKDVAEDPHILESQMLVRVPDEDFGELLQHNVLWKMSETPGEIRHTGTSLGHDTDALLGDLGYSAIEISALKDTGNIT